MKATILDLRYRMNDVLKALERNEQVSISYHGKQKGTIISSKGLSANKVAEHPFFNMRKTAHTTKMVKEAVLTNPPKHAPKRKKAKSVEQVMNKLRGGRNLDL